MRIYTYNELKESRIMMDKKPPRFGVIMTLITLIFVVGLILLAAFSVKTDVVKASGVSVSENKTNIMNKVSGNIDEILVKEGQYVETGDLIILINSLQVQLQITQLQSNADYFSKKVMLTNRLILFINEYDVEDESTHINPFDNTLDDEKKSFTDAQYFINYVNGQTDIENIRTQYISQYYTTLQEYEINALQYRSQVEMYEGTLSEYTIKAEQNGVIHLSSGISVGTVLSAGTLLGTVSDNNEDSYYFETYLSAIDRSKVNIGNEVEIAVSGVLQSEYGVLDGEVVAIDNDSTQTEDGNVYYRVIIKPNDTTLKDKKGNEIELSLGMVSESRIKYDSTTWLKWIIEQIGVKFR